MSISSVSPTASTQAKPLGMEDFLKVLLTQLTYQDPLKPMDNQQFMAQMAQFTSLQQTQELNDKMTTLVANQASLQSIGLLGRNVDITTDGGTTLSGAVTAISLSGASPLLSITTTAGNVLPNISLGQVIAVR
ncbi:flagellar hook capping protein [Caenimonas koreensis DSM 17982]|uniref:Basal-body rod modification protein FlgD n=1 Tax=Caenimonas koreensis DSM 17982 TaxID=1121255 RepID=A0A844AVZ0_9BURK|nr:flagellar hook capping FlgD N-terminal domain-containing protein [Caenimonas koreensis]MRD48680.1 flagellar hook capping protein [Caenimonas koreensis DSM 17982]